MSCSMILDSNSNYILIILYVRCSRKASQASYTRSAWLPCTAVDAIALSPTSASAEPFPTPSQSVDRLSH